VTDNEWSIKKMGDHPRDDGSPLTFEAVAHDNEGEPAMSAHVKWDGCVDMALELRDKDRNHTQLHLCDLDAFIDQLAALRELARKTFPDEEAWRAPESRLSEALGLIAAECGAFLLVARMGDQDDPSTWPPVGKRAYAIVGAEIDSDRAKAQILAAVIKWVEGERNPTETA